MWPMIFGRCASSDTEDGGHRTPVTETDNSENDVFLLCSDQLFRYILNVGKKVQWLGLLFFLFFLVMLINITLRF